MHWLTVVAVDAGAVTVMVTVGLLRSRTAGLGVATARRARASVGTAERRENIIILSLSKQGVGGNCETVGLSQWREAKRLRACVAFIRLLLLEP